MKNALKIKRFFNWPRLIALVGLGLLVIISLKHPLHAQSISQGFKTDQSLQSGMIVRIKPSDSGKVEMSSSGNAQDMYGVVVSLNAAPLTLSDNNQQVYVAANGRFDVLVSDQAGDIKSGDYITISSLDGIGDKATSSDVYIIGRALSSFDAKTNAVSKVEIKQGNSKQTVNIGRVQTEIAAARNPLHKTIDSQVPGVLQRASDVLAGKQVSSWRIYAATGFLLASVILSASLLYGGIRSAMTAIGRNPLSKNSITKGMTRVVVGGLVIFLTGVFAVYLILRI